MTAVSPFCSMATLTVTPRSTRPELPFKYVGGDPALDLVNTVDWTRRGMEQDRLTDYARLTRWAEGAGLISARTAGSLRSRAKAQPAQAETAFRMALQIRSVLWRTLTAVARGEPAADPLRQFNRLLAVALKQMRVAPVAERGQPAKTLQLAWGEAAERLDSFLWPVVWSAASLLVSGEARKIRICGGPDCGWMYVDRSRNQLRRWCQMETCGTREKSRRRRESGEAGKRGGSN
jgi:predicted RNA-binding Zn ribbon-like protein